ncbi:MAG TPA: energy transducer TonB [Gemmatimonadaceae bacterium]|jgi:protein TonB
MLGVLLESKARKQRRTAGVTLSVVLHVAIIGAVVVNTARGNTGPRTREKIVTVHIVPPPKPTEVHRVPRETSATPNAPTLQTDVIIKRVDAPPIVPIGLPPIDMSGGMSGDSIVVGGGRSGSGTAGIADLYNSEPTNDNRDWDARELLMHAITRTSPRYPEVLRSAGIDGHVLVQFTVDTTGRVDANSIRVLESTHELFTRAVREALGSFRFIPAQVAGHRVSALAQMPFEFHITR